KDEHSQEFSAHKFDYEKDTSLSRARQTSSSGLGKKDDKLYKILVRQRNRMIDKKGIAPDTLFSETFLKEMAHQKPLTAKKLSQLPEADSKIIEEFGEIFIRKIKQFIDRQESDLPSHERSFYLYQSENMTIEEIA